MKLDNIKFPKKKPKKVKEAINPALSFERKESEAKPRVKKKVRESLDPIAQSLLDNWQDFKENEPALPPIRESRKKIKQRLDPKCWKGKHKEGTKIKGGVRVNNCVPNESVNEEEKKGLYYYVNKRKKAGTSRPKGHPLAPSAQDWKDAARTAKKKSIEEAGSPAQQAAIAINMKKHHRKPKHVDESRMKDLAMDLHDLSDGEFFDKYKKSKGQMQSSLEPMYVVKDPASYNDDDFYAYDPNTKILRSTWSSNSVGRWASEADAQRKGLTIVRGMRAKNLGLKVKRRLQGMLEAKVEKSAAGTYDITKAKSWNPDPKTGTLSGRKRNIPGALWDLAKQGMGFKQTYNTLDIEADPRMKRHVNRYNDDDWIIIDPTSNSFVSAAPRGTSHHRNFTLATSGSKPNWNKIPGIPLPSTVSNAFGGQPYVAIPGHIANQRRIAEDQDVGNATETPYVVYVSNKPVGKFDTPEEAKRAAEAIYVKMPRVYIDIRKTQCTDVLLKTIAENENLYF